MRIVSVLDDSLDSDNGVQQVVRALGGYWADQGHDVHYIVAASRSTTGENVHAVGRTLTLRFNGNRVSTPLLVRRTMVQAFVRSQQFDVLHVQAPYGPLIGHQAVLSAAPTTAVVASFHMAPIAGYVTVGARLLGSALRRSRRRLDAITCDSSASEALLHAAWGTNGTIIGNPIDLRRFRSPPLPARRSRRCEIVFLGRLVERKGCAHLLRAIAGLPPRDRDAISVTIIGDGPLKGSLELSASRLGIDQLCSFVGRVDEEVKIRTLKAADLAVLPALGGESFGLVVLEAVAAGLATIVYDNPGYRSILRDTPDCLVPTGNVAHLARRISRYVHDGEARCELARNQRKVLGRYSLRVIGDEYLALFGAVMKRRLESL